MAYVFGYMGPNPAHAKIIQKAWPDGGGEGWKKVQSIGPSPVVIHKRDLEKVSKLWHETAVALKTDAAADSRLGWVIEMWGYAIAAAAVGLRHQEFRDFQVEPGALSTASRALCSTRAPLARRSARSSRTALGTAPPRAARRGSSRRTCGRCWPPTRRSGRTASAPTR